MRVELWYAAIGCAALFLVVPFAMIMEQVGQRLGLIDFPRPGEAQDRPLPRTGGYAVYAAFWLAILLSFALTPDGLDRLAGDNWRLLGVALGSLVLLPLALVDDARRLGAGVQVCGQVTAATVAALFGVSMSEVATPFGMIAIPPELAGLLAVVWIVGMINAINLLDSMDGLAGGVSAIACGVLFLRSVWFSQASIAILPAALGGALLGFLTRNWYPSRVILGSSGALFVGYMLGVVTLIGGVKIGTAFLVLAVPILDVAWVIYRRLSKGRSPFRGGDGEHLPHRLRALGLSEPVIVLALYSVCLAVGTAALALHSATPGLDKVVLIGVVVVAAVTGIATVAWKADRNARPPR